MIGYPCCPSLCIQGGVGFIGGWRGGGRGGGGVGGNADV